MENPNSDDPLAFLLNVPRPSASQEEFLSRTPFVGDTSSSHFQLDVEVSSVPFFIGDTSSSHFNADDVPSSSSPIFIQSLPDTQIPSQDVFLTPPEVLPLCTVNMVHDFVTQCGSDCSKFMDLGNDSDLGFLNENGSDLGFLNENGSDLGFLNKNDSDLGELPVKKQKLGFHSYSSGVQSMNVDVVVGGDERMNVDSVEKSDFCGDTEMGENLVSKENVETEGVEKVGDVNLNVGENSNDEIMEKKIRMSKMLGCVMEDEPNKNDEENEDFDDSFVFDVLGFLAERERKLSMNTDDEDEDEDDSLSLLKAFKDAGLTFTRPSWLTPDHWNSYNSDLLNCINFVD